MSDPQWNLEEDALRKEIERLKDLITELADALKFYEDPEIGVTKELLQRAQEALK